MKRLTSQLLHLLIFLFVFNLGEAQNVVWPEVDSESKPWTRWWWPNNAVDTSNIKTHLEAFAEAGIGGVEITPIYGVKGEEEREIRYLSQEFTQMLKYTIKEANKLGMGVDLPPGSGWRCGGDFVPEEKGLWNLKIEKVGLGEGEKWNWPLDRQNIEALLFVPLEGEKLVVQTNTNFVAEKSGSLYLAIREKSRDKVKRPAKGGEGWAIDTFNKDITSWYLDEIWKRLGIEPGMLRCFFHDSFEYTGDFTQNFMSEFKKRRAYDLGEYLHVLTGDCEELEIIARVKSDYRETLSEMVLESFIQPMTLWANQHKSLNRNQAHGSPGNILDLYAACDIPETEIFQKLNQNSPDVFVNKFASSAAHITGKNLVSSESYTWLKEHWTVTTSDMVQATNRFFLAGINHMFFHGSCYSPEDAIWPGWLFYASTQLNRRNSLWREMPTLFTYIGRSQSVLQEAQSQNDLLIYWPYFDVAASEGRIFNHIGVNKDAGWFHSHPISDLSRNLMNAGYTFDYISDSQLLKSKLLKGEILTEGLAKYKAIVIPKTNYIPVETLEQLKAFIAKGGKVYFDSLLPISVPGMDQLESRELRLSEIKSEILKENCVGDVVEMLMENGIAGEKALAENGIHFLKMMRGDENWYMIFNTSSKSINEWIEFNSSAESYVFFDPMNGDISLAQSENNQVRLQLDSEEAMFIRCARNKADIQHFVYEETNQNATKIGALWKIEFLEGGPVFPGNLQSDELLSWTKLGDRQTERFAGTVEYSTEFNWSGDSKMALLNLGNVKDCARVKLNGKTSGVLLGPNFKIKLKNLVKGTNSLQIEVTNVAANRIRDLDIKGIEWRKFYDINFVNIDYQPFDASSWPVKEAGLIGPVTLSEL